jgi:hypothetical protein
MIMHDEISEANGDFVEMQEERRLTCQISSCSSMDRRVSIA